MPTVAFHVTSTRNRESILQHGLDWNRMLDQPGIAVYNPQTLKGWWRVTAPNGHMAVVQQTDVGPAPWTGRGAACSISRDAIVLEGTSGVLGTFIQTRTAAATAVNGTSHPMAGVRHHGRVAGGGAVFAIAASRRCVLGAKLWPPQPGFTARTNTRSTSSRSGSTTSTGVPGLSAMPRVTDEASAWRTRCGCCVAST